MTISAKAVCVAAAVFWALPATAGDADILGLRERIRAAAASKDRTVLEQMLADNFTHQREGGRTDLKRERIELLVSGEQSIETASEDELVIADYGENTASASGLSRIRDPETSRLVSYRWLAVYARIGGRWRLATSTAHRAR